jgi:hypothetical protein
MNRVFNILLIKAFVLILINPFLQDKNPFDGILMQFEKVPIMELSFYMMGRDHVDDGIIQRVNENVQYLNQEFEDKVKFEVKHYFIDDGFAMLPDLHKEYFGVEELTVDSLVKNLENKGSINVFIFDSYVEEEINAELMGFTPIFRTSQHDYRLVSPTFDRIFIAYGALEKQTTLVHEMGHFLGLEHPWEMNEKNKDVFGLANEEDIKENHMAYGIEVHNFTPEQLDRMQQFALEYRSYLIERTEFNLKNSIASYIED